MIEGEKGSIGEKGTRGEKGQKGMPGTCDTQVVKQKPSQYLSSKGVERTLRMRLIFFFIAITYYLGHDNINTDGNDVQFLSGV